MQFDKLLAGYGYSSRNLADAMSADFAINWQVIHGTDFNDKKGSDAVRKMIAETLTSSGKLATATNTEKQMLAETFGYQAMIAMQSYKNNEVYEQQRFTGSAGGRLSKYKSSRN